MHDCADALMTSLRGLLLPLFVRRTEYAVQDRTHGVNVSFQVSQLRAALRRAGSDGVVVGTEEIELGVGAHPGSPPRLPGELPLERLMEPFDVAAGLRVIRHGVAVGDPEGGHLQLHCGATAPWRRGEHRTVVGEHLHGEPMGPSRSAEGTYPRRRQP